MTNQFLYFFCGMILLLFACETPSSNTTTKDFQVHEEEATTGDESLIDTAQYKIKEGHVILSWADLAKVNFKMDYSEELESEVPFPIFSEEMKALEGKQVMIEGYVIPVEETGDNSIIILSAFPYTQCFFCGAAGPESVMDILSKERIEHLKMDDEVTFKGKLKLNDSDLDYLNYILEEAKLVE